MSDELQNAATIASLRAEVERLTDYNQRLLAENVRLTNRQSMDREEIESMGRRNDELMKALWTSAEYVKRLESDVARLANDKRGLLDEMDEMRDDEDRADSLSNSIITACTGSGCLNAHELRVALDNARERVREWNVLVAQGCTPGGSEFHDTPQNVARYIKERTEDKDRIIKSQQRELNKARERAGVLEREVRAWRDASDNYTGDVRIVYGQAGHIETIAAARAETDRTHALDAAKFGGAT